MKNMEYSTFELPVFANDANRWLHKETNDLHQKLTSTEAFIDDESSRVEAMRKHIESIRAEIEHTNNLLSAKKRAIHAEQHLVTISLLERGRIQKEINRLSSEADSERNRLKLVQENTSKLREDLDIFKTSMNWNQEELEQWATAAAQKEDDNFALQSYLHSDELRVKELGMTLQRLTLTAAEKRVELDNEISETNVCQVELERTAHFFKLRQAEINRLVAQWRSTVEKMRQIDSEVGKAIRDYNMQSALKRSMMEELKHSKERVQILDVSLPPEVFYSFFSLHV
jgi:chromosome segregation ATPase